MLQACEPPRKPFHLSLVSSQRIVNDGYSNPMDFWANAELQSDWAGESLQNGAYECKLEQFLMPNNVKSFNVLDLHTNKSIGFIEIVMEVKKSKNVHMYRNTFHMPHRNWKVSEVVDWVNCTVRNTWADIYTIPTHTNPFGDLLVNKLCTGEVVESSEFVQWNTHPESASKHITMLTELFAAYKRPFVINGSLSHIWILISNPLRDFLGTTLNGFILPPPEENSTTPVIHSTCIWHIDCEAKTHPFISFTKSTVPGPITSIVVRSNLVVGENDLNEVCSCIVPDDEHTAIELGLSTGAVWKRVKAYASLKAIHLVVSADDGRLMPFKGGVVYYLFYFRPC